MKKIVVCFSGTGTTMDVAKRMQILGGLDFYEIKPKEPYTKEDLDWYDNNSRTSIEMKDPNTRPEFIKDRENFDEYDTIYLGFPVWWYACPHIINNFIETYDFSKKTVKAFFTSGSTNEDVIEKYFNNAYPGLISSFKRCNNITDDEIKAWLG